MWLEKSYIYIYIHTHTHTHTHICKQRILVIFSCLYLRLYNSCFVCNIYIYIVCVCVCVYTHTHTHTHILYFFSHTSSCCGQARSGIIKYCYRETVPTNWTATDCLLTQFLLCLSLFLSFFFSSSLLYFYFELNFHLSALSSWRLSQHFKIKTWLSYCRSSVNEMTKFCLAH